jgi:phosphoserine aminotransferase
VRRADDNLKVIETFVADNDWIDFLAKDPKVRSNTSVCLSLKLSKDQIKKMTTLLEKEGVAYDIGSYRCVSSFSLFSLHPSSTHTHSSTRSLTHLCRHTSTAADVSCAVSVVCVSDAPPGLRIWCGATVEKSDLEALMPWLKWAYHMVL